jgi:MerR family transcriptional regulator/heat shock protein HspR
VLEAEVRAAYQRVAELEATGPYPRRDLVPTSRPTTALVVWRPRKPSDGSG